MPHTRRSSSLPSCFQSPSVTDNHHHTPDLPPPPHPISGNPNLTTCLYRTELGLFSLTWSRSAMSRSVHVTFHHHQNPFDLHAPTYPFVYTPPPLSLSTFSVQINVTPLFFWKKSGSKPINAGARGYVEIFWDFTKSKFGSGPEAVSGFFIAVVVDGEMSLLVGDCVEEAFRRTRARRAMRDCQVLVLRREHMVGSKVYVTRAKFGGKTREISIDCRLDNDAKLIFNVDGKRVLSIKRLKWKFRGNEKIEVDGVGIQVSWDVYNWLFEDSGSHKHGVFMFRFEKEDKDSNSYVELTKFNDKNETWHEKSCSFGMNAIEWTKMRKTLFRQARSHSSSSLSLSLSSASSACSSSVMEWANSEENELCNDPAGFSLLVYAWRK